MNEDDVKKMLKQIEQDGILGNLTTKEKAEAMQTVREILSDMPQELFSELAFVIDKIEAEETNFVDIAQKETDALFDKLGLGR